MINGNLCGEIYSYRCNITDPFFGKGNLTLVSTLFDDVKIFDDNSLIVICFANEHKNCSYQAFIIDNVVSVANNTPEGSIAYEVTYAVRLLNHIEHISDSTADMPSDVFCSFRDEAKRKLGKDVFNDRNVNPAVLINKVYLAAVLRHLDRILSRNKDVSCECEKKFRTSFICGNPYDDCPKYMNLGADNNNVFSFEYKFNNENKGIITIPSSTSAVKHYQNGTVVMTISHAGYTTFYDDKKLLAEKTLPRFIYRVFVLDSFIEENGVIANDIDNCNKKVSYMATLLDADSVPAEVIEMTDEEFDSLRDTFKKKNDKDLFFPRVIEHNIANKMYLRFMVDNLDKIKNNT